MVNPIYIFIIVFAAAFLIPLLHRLNRFVAGCLFYFSLTAISYITFTWLTGLLAGGIKGEIFTAGFLPPLSIHLQMGIEEAFFLVFINFFSLLTAIYLAREFRNTSIQARVLFLMLVLGLNGVVMTRDLFNLFVFLEISSISTYSLISLEQNRNSITAGFKYMLAGGLASTFFLIGTIYLYRITGTLNLDQMLGSGYLLAGKAGFIALFTLLIALFIELKPFPANGWALDVYQSVHPGIAAFIASAVSAAMFFALFKILPLVPVHFLPYIAGMGAVTFLLSNLMGLKQTSARRLLGYSSLAQMGLLVMALALIYSFNLDDFINSLIIVIGGLFVNHFLAKAGLFWLAGVIHKKGLNSWSLLKSYPSLLFMFGAFIFALVGLPPFPGFWAKWQLIIDLAAHNLTGWIWIILVGSLLEAVYLLRWLGLAVKGEEEEKLTLDTAKFLPIFVILLGLLYAGLEGSKFMEGMSFNFLIPILTGAIIFVLKWLPAKVEALLSILAIAVFGYFIYPGLNNFGMIFGVIFLLAAVILIIGTMHYRGSRKGFYPLLLVMLLALGNLITATTSLQFFVAWEMMTISSYLLILRGRRSRQAALQYVIFSLAGAYLILAGFAFSYLETGTLILDSLASLVKYGTPVYILLALGFLIKTGALGFHIWLPQAYSESEDDFTPMIAAVLSKVGIFGLISVAILLGDRFLGPVSINYILGWLGVLTALFGALMATFQEDIKKLVAYSSMSQIGYIILAFSLLTHLGWVTALYLSFNHLFFKAIIFLGVAGVISRLGTRKMYEMGGMINNMPLTFLSVLIAIIALSGVPPLSGFGGKWLLYTSLLEKGWYLQAGVAFFASTVAFLYCYRILHAVFLGQRKPIHRLVKEPSLWLLIPQYIFLLTIMAISVFPNLILKPLIQAVTDYYPGVLDWNGYQVISSLGYWNGHVVMIVTMGVFMLPLIWLLLRLRSITKVKQFNIVYAAERPDRPETTHFAYNFFSHYQKALGFLVRSRVTSFWNGIAEGAHSLGAMFRQIYTGNGQTYALHILLFAVLLYLIAGVK